MINKKLIITIFWGLILFLISHKIHAQGIEIKTGGIITINGSASIEINNGDFINNGTYSKDSETILLTGSIASRIAGDNNIEFNNLSISNTEGITSQVGLLTANNLTISTGSNLTIEAQKNVSINNTLENNAGSSGLVLESNASGTASLIQYTPGVQATVERYVTTNSWHYMFSPLSEIATTTYVYEGTFINYNLYSYNESTSDYWNATTTFGKTGWEIEYMKTYLPIDKGYIYNRTTLPSEIFSQTGGNLFVGQKNFSVNYTVNTGVIGNEVTQGWPAFDGWNLIGNPYTSAIDWDLIDKTDIESGVYLYDGNNYQYYIYGGGNSPWDAGITLNGGTHIIPSGQGFFVKVKNDSTTHSGIVTIPENARVHNAQPFYKSSPASVSNILKLRISNQNASDETVIRTVPYATEWHDSKYDASKLYSLNKIVPQIYSQNIVNNDNYAINAIPEIENNKEIPIGVYAGVDGQYTINIKENSFEGYFIWLEDKLLGVYQNILQNTVYSFNQKVGNNNTRFVLHFGINHAPTAAKIEDQSVYVNDDFEFTIPNNTFSDADSSDVITLSAKLADGNKLPDWLSFDALTGRFYGLPDSVESIELEIAATDIFGKSAKSTFNILVLGKTLSVESPVESFSVIVYPNPSSGIFNIKTNNLSNSKLLIHDMAGRITLQKELSSNIESVNLKSYAKGIYLLELVNKKGTIRKKIEIQ
jgi:hypothetical protein